MSTKTDRCACCAESEYVIYLDASSRYWCRRCELQFEMVYSQRKARDQLSLPLEVIPGRRP